MQLLMNVLQVAQILTALGMIGLVLMQHGKGADMGASFGSGASGSLFGATGSANFLSRTTAFLATVFFVCTLALAYFGSDALRAPAASGGGSVLDQPLPASAVPVPQPSAGEIPGLAPAPDAASPAATPASNEVPQAASTPAADTAAVPAATAASPASR